MVRVRVRVGIEESVATSGEWPQVRVGVRVGSWGWLCGYWVGAGVRVRVSVLGCSHRGI